MTLLRAPSCEAGGRHSERGDGWGGGALETSSQQTERPESRLAKVNLTRGP